MFGALALTNAGIIRASHPPDVHAAPHNKTSNTPPGADNWALVFARPAAGKYEEFAFPDTTNGWLISASGVIFHTAGGDQECLLHACQGIGVAPWAPMPHST